MVTTIAHFNVLQDDCQNIEIICDTQSWQYKFWPKMNIRDCYCTEQLTQIIAEVGGLQVHQKADIETQQVKEI